MRNSKEMSEASKMAKNGQKGDFQSKWHFVCSFFKIMGENQDVMDFSHVRVPYGTNKSL